MDVVDAEVLMGQCSRQYLHHCCTWAVLKQLALKTRLDSQNYFFYLWWYLKPELLGIANGGEE